VTLSRPTPSGYRHEDGLTVKVEALILSVHHVVNASLIVWHYRLRLRWIEPIRGEDDVYAASVRLGFH